MKQKIKIKDVELELEGEFDIEIDGTKISVKANPYTYFYQQPYITFPTQPSTPSWITSTSSVNSDHNENIVATFGTIN
jgi:hypothetical protein